MVQDLRSSCPPSVCFYRLRLSTFNALPHTSQVKDAFHDTFSQFFLASLMPQFVARLDDLPLLVRWNFRTCVAP